MSNLSKVIRDVWSITKRHSPEILTGIGITGMISTTVIAVKATPKALSLIEKAKNTKKAGELTPVEIIKATWSCYIPAMVTAGISVACLIGANSVNLRRNAALATVYTLSESALKEYREKVIETIGHKKEQTVKDAVAKDKIDKRPPVNRAMLDPNSATRRSLKVHGQGLNSKV